MAIEINTQVSVGESYGNRVGNLTLLNAKFFGRPNFSGVEDRFKDSRRKFTVLIPNETADELRALGWNVKTTIPTQEELREFPDREPISHLKVMVDNGAIIQIRMGENVETLAIGSFGVIDRSRIEEMDMEIRAWEYDPEERPGQYSARLVALVANIRPNILEQKYGMLS